MITNIEIKNYKSIEKIELPLGRVNVFIGENGAGKSNILEAIALSGAASAGKLDSEFLASRGIRVTKPEYMRAAFHDSTLNESIEITAEGSNDEVATFLLSNDNAAYSKWAADISTNHSNLTANSLIDVISSIDHGKKLSKEGRDAYLDFLNKISEFVEKTPPPDIKPNERFRITLDNKRGYKKNNEFLKALSQAGFKNSPLNKYLSNFIVFSPENSALRLFEKEGQIEPLGINGEGLLKLLHFYERNESSKLLHDIEESLSVLGWFVTFTVSRDSADGKIFVKDRYINESCSDFDHRSTNEGFLFLLFYFLLFRSELTPKFFAIDNIDASLNPKLCQRLIQELTKLSKEHEKQVVLTTHNPAVLDGLNLDDDEQRLFVVSRKRNGATKVTRIFKKNEGDQRPQKLSELFLRGVIGGLPKGF